MTETQVLTCPGCHKLAVFDTYEQHIRSGHVEGLYNSSMDPSPAVAQKSRTWYDEIVLMLKTYPKGFAMWSILLLLLAWIMLWGRV